MNGKTKQDAVDVIESRLDALAKSHGSLLQKHGIQCEASAAIDMAGLCGAIDSTEQRHFKERLNKIVERDHQQWAEQHGVKA